MKQIKKRKIFVLDTSVLLVDPSSFRKFGENDVIIPLDVISELDGIKKYNDSVGVNARTTVKLLDEVFSDEIFESGVSLGQNKGSLFMYSLKELNQEVKKTLKDDTVDHRIISVALNLKQKRGQNKEVVVVSNDTNLRFKSSSFGLASEFYQNDRIESIDDLYKGIYYLEDSTLDEFIDSLYQKRAISLNKIPNIAQLSLSQNQFLVIKSNTKSILCNIKGNEVCVIQKKEIYGRINPRNAEQTLAIDALLDKDLNLITLNGPAGTGKTLLAIGAALSQIKEYDQIFISRPIVPMSNKDLGFLPGDIASKISPYMQPLYDNIKFLKQANGGDQKKKSTKIDEMIENGTISLEALAYIRGRTLPKILFIVDEAQNLTPSEIKTIITRMGEGSKIIFTGDIYQIDHPYLDAYSNGLTYLIEKAKDYDKAAHISLEKGERSELSEWAAKNL